MSFLLLFSCDGSHAEENDGQQDVGDGDGVLMLADITEISDVITVEVVESEYTFGIHWVLTSENTKIVDSDGTPIRRADLKVGDRVEIVYSGQVMMSYPPKINALKITRK